jgi:hypothetical protein
MKGHSVLNENFVVLFGWNASSARSHVEHMGNEQEQKKRIYFGNILFSY